MKNPLSKEEYWEAIKEGAKSAVLEFCDSDTYWQSSMYKAIRDGASNAVYLSLPYSSEIEEIIEETIKESLKK